MSGLAGGSIGLALLGQAAPTALPDQAIEWLKFGLLGLVLLWMFFFHLPAKDRQTKEMVDANAAERAEERKSREAQESSQTAERDKEREERERERVARHDMANSLQSTVNTLVLNHEKQMLSQAEQHRTEADRDRTAFMLRASEQTRALDSLQRSIESQTLQIVAAIGKSCQFQPQDSRNK